MTKQIQPKKYFQRNTTKFLTYFFSTNWLITSSNVKYILLRNLTLKTINKQIFTIDYWHFKSYIIICLLQYNGVWKSNLNCVYHYIFSHHSFLLAGLINVCFSGSTWSVIARHVLSYGKIFQTVVLIMFIICDTCLCCSKC